MTQPIARPAPEDWANLKPGLKVGPLTQRITPATVRAYCDALGVDANAYLVPRDGPPVAPPTLLATAYSALLRPHLNLGHGLMARHAMQVRRPIPVGEDATVSGELVETFERKGRHYWTLRCAVHDARGETCVLNEITCSVD